MELIEWGGGGRMGGIYTTVGGIERNNLLLLRPPIFMYIQFPMHV